MKYNPKIFLALPLFFCLESSAHGSKEEVEKEQKPAVVHYPEESQRVKDQKDAGILEGERDYSKKSEYVKNRDRVEGAAQKVGDAIKDTTKKLFS